MGTLWGGVGLGAKGKGLGAEGGTIGTESGVGRKRKKISFEKFKKRQDKITSTAPPNIADNIPRAIVSVSVINAVPNPSSSACIMAQARFSVDSMKMSICEAFLRMASPSLSHISAIR